MKWSQPSKNLAEEGLGTVIGRSLGPYRILEQIGIGGMATVYKAYDPGTDRSVAIKVLPHQYSQHPKFRERFQREVKAIAKLEHPYILPVHAFGEEEGIAFLVMRYLQAGTLKERIEAGPIDLEAAGRIVDQIASALDCAHRNGVIHRDVKPSNILLDAEGNAYLTDFGIAKILEATIELTGTGTAIGTPQYMSPEQCKGAKTLGPASDIYSLGVVLYQMLTGRVPFDAETPLAVIQMHLNEPLPPPRTIDPSIPEAVERVILKALAKEPQDRNETASGMAEALRSAVWAAKGGAAALVTRSRSEPLPRAVPEITKAKKPAGSLRKYWGVGVAMLAIATAAVLFARDLPSGFGLGLGRSDTPEVTLVTSPVEEPTSQAPTERPAPPTAAAVKTGIDCMGASAGDQVTLVYPWEGAAEESFVAIVEPLLETCGIIIDAESSSDPELVSNRLLNETPWDIVIWPILGSSVTKYEMRTPLEYAGVHAEDYASYWVDLGTESGNRVFAPRWLAVPIRADVKSMIWYSPKAFELQGYEVPSTFPELESLVEGMVARGDVPWAMGLASGETSGRVGADFIQELLLAQQGPDYVLGLQDGSVSYNDAGVVEAYRTYRRWAADSRYTAGGADGTLLTNSLAALGQPFARPPQAMMVYGGTWAGQEIAGQQLGFAFGEDYGFFPFPGGKALQVEADWLMVFNRSRAAQALTAYLTSVEGAQRWASVGFDLSPNSQAAGAYQDPLLAGVSEVLYRATGVSPDLGDTLGGEFQTAEWSAVLDIVGGANIERTLAGVAGAQRRTLEGQ